MPNLTVRFCTCMSSIMPSLCYVLYWQGNKANSFSTVVYLKLILFVYIFAMSGMAVSRAFGNFIFHMISATSVLLFCLGAAKLSQTCHHPTSESPWYLQLSLRTF